jgi:hypothetical protein
VILLNKKKGERKWQMIIASAKAVSMRIPHKEKAVINGIAKRTEPLKIPIR